ncbi:MAG: hypothetical protein MUF87_20105 [Anaerolineae bacterium]|nr:hypothetical protein [Anaerolineae bacterium]
MFKVLLLALLLLVGSGTALHAQEITAAPFVLAGLTTQYDPNGNTLTLNLQIVRPDGCELPVAVNGTQRANALFLDLADVIYDSFEAPETSCSNQPVRIEYPYTIYSVTPEQDLSIYHRLLVIAGDAIFGVPITTGNFSADLQFGETFALQKVPVTVQQTTQNLDLTVSATVEYNDICYSEILSRETIVNGQLNLEVFRVRPVGLECRVSETPFVRLINLPVSMIDLPITVNGLTAISPTLPSEPSGPLVRIPLSVDSADVLLMESFPVQVSVIVRGYVDGCEGELLVEQTQEGNTITLEVYRELPADIACTMIAIQVEKTINLGALPSGDYTIIVNGVELTVTV